MDSHQPPLLAHATTSAHGGVLENLKSLLMKCAIASAPAKSLSRQRQTLIKKRIQELVPTIHTPDHPPYAWMIEDAIKQLNEEGGSDEAAISKFIFKEYKDLPWIHAALLNHHLKRLSITGNLTRTHYGCYFIGSPTNTNDPDSKPNLRINCTARTSRSPSPSPSPSPVSSFSPTSASSDTSGSSQSFDLKKKRNCRKRSHRQKQNPRGIRIHPKYKEGRARARARAGGRGRVRVRVRDREGGGDICMDGKRVVEILSLLTEDEATDDENMGRGEEVGDDIRINGTQVEEILSLLTEDEATDDENMGRGREVGSDIHMDGTRVVEILSLLTEDEATDDENIPRKEAANQDYVNLECLVQQSIMNDIEVRQEHRINEPRIEPLQQNMGDNRSTPRTIPSSHGRKPASEKGSKRIRPQRLHPRHKPQTGRGRGRPRKRDMQMMEGETQCANRVEQEEGDSMDELIEQVCIELTKPTEILCLTTDGEAAEENLQTKELNQVEMNQEVVNVQIEIPDLTEMQNKISSQSVADDIYDVEPQGHESKFTDDLNEQQQPESKLAKVVGETKASKKRQGYLY